MARQNTEEVVRRLIAPVAEAQGVVLWDVRFVKEGSEHYLRVTLDKEGGVDIDDCEKAMKTVDPIVTDLDPVEGAYHLEVSSPGLERTLRTDAHFAAVTGEKISVKLFTAVEGQKILTGILEASDGKTLTLNVGGKKIPIERKLVSAANVYFDFDGVDYGEDGEEVNGTSEETNGNV